MKEIAKVVNQLTMDDVVNYEQNKQLNLIINNENICFEEDAFDVITEDVPGWKIATNEHITVALDLQISSVLKNEGIARDLVNRVQNIRKESLLDVTDFIEISIKTNNDIKEAINHNLNYICSETLAKKIIFENDIKNPFFAGDNDNIQLSIEKIN